MKARGKVSNEWQTYGAHVQDAWIRMVSIEAKPACILYLFVIYHEVNTYTIPPLCKSTHKQLHRYIFLAGVCGVCVRVRVSETPDYHTGDCVRTHRYPLPSPDTSRAKQQQTPPKQRGFLIVLSRHGSSRGNSLVVLEPENNGKSTLSI